MLYKADTNASSYPSLVKIMRKKKKQKCIWRGLDCALDCGLYDLHDNDSVCQRPYLIPGLVKYLSLQPTPLRTIRAICYSIGYKRNYFGRYSRLIFHCSAVYHLFVTGLGLGFFLSVSVFPLFNGSYKRLTCLFLFSFFIPFLFF